MNTTAQPFHYQDSGGYGFSAPPVAPVANDSRLANYGGMGVYGIGYDAVNHRGNRRQVGARTSSEELELRDLARRQLTTTNRDLVRNFTIASWMVRRHLDSVSSFHFRPKTGDSGLDKDLLWLMNWWSRPENCDSAARHSLHELMRLWECHRTIDGDCLINRIKTGKIQTIEGERVQTFGSIPYSELGIKDPSWVQNGVWTNEYNRALGYMVFRRPPQWTGLIFDRMIPARFADLFGYYFRIDQVRGIAPLASAANNCRDIYEGLDYALLKAKATQFLGMQITRAAADPLNPSGQHGDNERRPIGPDGRRYQGFPVNRGPQLVEMDPGDEMKVIESQTPSTQFQGFTSVMIMICLKALDLPYSFFDESHTNFNGSRMAGIGHNDASKIKRQRLRCMLDKITAWRLGLFIADDELVLPSKMEPSDLKWEWAHRGIPLFNPLQEVSANIAAVNACLASPQQIHQQNGTDFFQTVDEIAEARDYCVSKGVVMATALASTAADDPNKGATKTEDQNLAEDDDSTIGKDNEASDKARAEHHNAMWRW